jgi:hypothetical protein
VGPLPRLDSLWRRDRNGHHRHGDPRRESSSNGLSLYPSCSRGSRPNATRSNAEPTRE